MMTSNTGVYQIRCLPTGKIYVGSAVNIAKRWGAHRSSLRRGCHVNKYLQAAWNKYGEEYFILEILELVDVSSLLEAEQEWIISTNCTDRCVGFNVRDTAESSGAFNGRVWEGFVDPEGNDVTIINLQEFCRKHKLNVTAMGQLARGGTKLKSHKGWTHKNSIRQRDYVKTYTGFIDPNGHEAGPITNLAKFCRQHNLDNTHMIAVLRGRICSHRGWTHIHARKRPHPTTYTGFINPDGTRVIVTNLAKFCRENNLHPVKMRQLMAGGFNRYKGWTWKEKENNGEQAG